jgi:hypothetical protein
LDWLERTRQKHEDPNAPPSDDPYDIDNQLRRLSERNQGIQVIGPALHDAGTIINMGAPSPGVGGSEVTTAVGEAVKFVWGLVFDKWTDKALEEKEKK